ncbi:mitotic checkpoint prcc-carboxy-term protein [Toxoplasma gondii p89]|uniref:Mitotic checkpoint prcc-carboxy-term protein n=1 Tax=Toxoplasma gondii p89 TaxID=943119 RepID=A0A086KDC2_TOXGO|nr:mitotic checkpoint prcc-carboxy-term protein [Toxoplasma gondii p89]
MLGDILSSYAEEDESTSTSSKSGPKNASANAALSGWSYHVEVSVPRKNVPVNLLRLQMCCPAIIGAGADRGSALSAHGLFATATSSVSSRAAFPVPKNGKHELSRGSPASVSTATGNGKGKTVSSAPGAGSNLLASPDVIIGPDNVPLLQYGRGVFANAEEEDVEEFRLEKLRQHRLRKEARENQQKLSPDADGLPPQSTRSQALLRRLPKPQSATAASPHADGWSLPTLRRGRSEASICLTEGNKTDGNPTGEGKIGGGKPPEEALGSFAGADLRAKCVKSEEPVVDESAEASDSEGASGVGSAQPQKRRRTAPEAPESSKGEDEGDDADSGSGPLFSLFSAYDEENEEAEAPAAAPVKREATAATSAFAATSEAPATPSLSPLEKKLQVHAVADLAQAAAPLYGPEDPGDAASAADVWGGGETGADGADGDPAQPHMMQGMSLREYREMQQASVGVLSGDTLIDPNWQMNAQLYGSTAQKKREKLVITTNVWSAKDKGVVQTQEPRGMQKRKHQINWLAAEAAEKELEMWEMLSKNRQNKYQTAMKYGW